LKQGRKPALVVPVGTPAEYLGENRFAVTLKGRQVEWAVVKGFTDQYRLARDVVAGLAGEKKALRARDYALPRYAYAPAALCLALPLFTLLLLIFGGRWWLNVLSLLLGLGLAAGCLVVLERRRWAAALRGLAMAGLTAGGYGFVLAAFFLALLLARPDKPAAVSSSGGGNGPAPGKGPDKEAALPADLDLVPRDGLGFLCLRVADVWQGEANAPLRKTVEENPLLGIVLGEMKKATGLTPDDIERVVVIAPAGDPKPPEPLVAVTASKPVNRDDVVKKLLQGAEEKKVGGKSFFTARGAAVHFVGDRTALAGDPGDLEAFLKRPPAEGAGGPLAEALREATGKHALLAGLSLRSVTGLAKKNLPPEAEPFLPLLEARLTTVTVDLGGKQLDLKVRMAFADEGGAQKGEQAAQTALRMGQQAFPGLVQALQGPPGRPPDPFVAKLLPALKDVEAALKEASFTRDGSVVRGAVHVKTEDPSSAFIFLLMMMGPRAAKQPPPGERPAGGGPW
jgi:hypothetical protein